MGGKTEAKQEVRGESLGFTGQKRNVTIQSQFNEKTENKVR
jgi:hypothetical protein